MNSKKSAAPVTLHYRRQFYQESLVRGAAMIAERSGATGGATGGPAGLVGREVANATFLRAFLRSGESHRIDVLIHDADDQASLTETLDRHLPATKQARLTPLAARDRWASLPGDRVLWEPQPVDAAWARWRQDYQAGNPDAPRIALCGVTHTMATPGAARALADLIAAPLQPWDCLVCPSEAVRRTTQALLEHAAQKFLSDAKNASSPPRQVVFPRLEKIPLGVDTDHHRVATAKQRADMRRRLGIPHESQVVLFVGRLSHHAKANPMPLWAACQQAATRQASREKRSSPRIDLVMAGWFANEATRKAFATDAARVAPDVQTHFVDGRDPATRDCVWHAADVFVSLADSVQETFGLTVTEAISRGLPVIASDWNGYREIVRHGIDGFLVPTTVMTPAPRDALVQMHEGSLSYDHFLASTGQLVQVDCANAAESLCRLLADDSLRSKMAASGRRRAVEQFAWPRVIARYEELWRRQIEMTEPEPAPRCAVAENLLSLETLFAAYPTRWIGDDRRISAVASPLMNWDDLQRSVIANHSVKRRLPPAQVQDLVRRLRKDGRRDIASVVRDAIGDLSGTAGEEPFSNDAVRRGIAWALKYGFLELQPDDAADRSAELTYAVTCMGRLEHLKQSLPALVRNGRGPVVLVDYSCPDGCGDWAESHFSASQVRVVRVTGKQRFDRSEAKNLAIKHAATPWVCLIDADVIIGPTFADAVLDKLRSDSFLRSSTVRDGTGGTFVARREDLATVGYHDSNYQGWGEEDDDLIDALKFAGLRQDWFDAATIRHLDHDDELRTRFHDQSQRRVSHMINRLYRTAKWDSAKIAGEVPSPPLLRKLYRQISEQIEGILADGRGGDIVIKTGQMNWTPLAFDCEREIRYCLTPDENGRASPYVVD